MRRRKHAVITVMSLVPVGLGLFLLTFGLPERRLLAFTPRNTVLVGIAAVLVGPVALIELGLAGWLALIALLVACVLFLAGLSPSRRRPADQR